MSWKNPPIDFSHKLLKDADQHVKRLAGDVLTSVVTKTPVDKGTARGNWRVGVNHVDHTADLNVRDPSGTGAMQIGLSVIEQGAGIGKVVYIANSLPYIQRLNDGWSQQAPANFVQISLMNVVNKYK